MTAEDRDPFKEYIKESEPGKRDKGYVWHKALAQVGLAKPQYIPRILSCLQSADLSKYKDSMRPLIEKDITETQTILTNYVMEK